MNGRLFEFPTPKVKTETFDPDGAEEVMNRNLVLFENDGSSVEVLAGHEGMRFLYISGEPCP